MPVGSFTTLHCRIASTLKQQGQTRDHLLISRRRLEASIEVQAAIRHYARLRLSPSARAALLWNSSKLDPRRLASTVAVPAFVGRKLQWS